MGIGVDSEGKIYVSDSTNARVQIFANDGTFISKWGQYGYATSSFLMPLGLVIDKYDRVMVSDYYTNAVKRFTKAGVWSP